MAKRRIVWTRRAEEELLSVLEYYNWRNESHKYSLKILGEVEIKTNLISSYPEIGRLTDNQKSRIAIIEHFLLFYEVEEQTTVILSFWDNRQDPKKRIDSDSF